MWVLFVHSLYWTDIIPNTNVYKSYLLFEMPLLFFITGSSYSLGKITSKTGFYIKRITRVILPFFVYTVITYFFIIGTARLDMILPDNHSWDKYSIFSWHLWFIPTYLSVIILLPVFQFVFNKLNGIFKITPLICFVLGIYFLEKYQPEQNIRYVIFYSFWVYLGLFYRTFKKQKFLWKYQVTITAIFWVLTWIIIQLNLYSPNMQLNKFPPNLGFLLLNIGTLCFLSLIKNSVLNIIQKYAPTSILSRFITHGYTIYLYQPFGFFTIKYLFTYLNLKLHSSIAISVYFVGSIFWGLLFAKLVGFVEDYSKSIKNENLHTG